MKRLGASVDWQREYFTMDERLSVAVREAFVRLHEQGLIYRGAYIVNWCPRCQTAISDLEVVHDEQKGHLWEIRYPVIDADGKDTGEFLTVATTRPETMLGDVAVAIHPEDERYLHLHGKKLRLPLMDREIPIILDEWVSRDFGTGAVKVTPAHDPNDFALGERHHLPSINVMDDTGHINAEGGAYAGLDRYVARKKIVADLEEQGLLAGIKDHTNNVGHCDRCKTVVEPRLSTQWFVPSKFSRCADEGRSPRVKPDAERQKGHPLHAGDVREDLSQLDGEHPRLVHLAPALVGPSHPGVALRRLPQDHRRPRRPHRLRPLRLGADHAGDRRARHLVLLGPAAGLRLRLAQSHPDAPVSIGTGKARADFDAFYPTSLLVTGFDILFFWVARMIMLGCWFAGDVPMPDGSPRPLADSVPFREVYIHALVRDANREKMSKTKGNVVDPIEIVKQYGTDAVRFTLASMASPGTDIAFNVARTEGYRAFANKIWNAARFLFMNVDRAAEIGITVDPAALGSQCRRLPPMRRSKRAGSSPNCTATAAKVNAVARKLPLRRCGQHDLPVLLGQLLRLVPGDRQAAAGFLQETRATRAARRKSCASPRWFQVFEASLRLLSPFMPFLTEEIWHALYDGNPPAKSIALTRVSASRMKP